jgi:hypothetical protein
VAAIGMLSPCFILLQEKTVERGQPKPEANTEPLATLARHDVSQSAGRRHRL